MDAEGGLIARVLETPEGILEAMERRITVVHFQNEWHLRVWTYLVDHWHTYGSPADLDVVLTAYPSYLPEEPTQDIKYYIDHLLQRQGMSTMLAAINEAVETHAELGTEALPEMTGALRDALEQVHLETAPVRTVDYADQMLRSIEKWRKVEEDMGWSYGLPTLDQHTSGMHPEQYVIFTGLAKAKKSWCLLHVASTAHIMGAKVIFITFEMSNSEQIERLATFWAKVPFTFMRNKSLLTEQHFTDIGRFARMRKNLHPLIGVEDAFGYSTVSSIQALIKEENADIVCIDGVYLMTDEVTGEPGSAGTQQLTNISRALKRMATATKITVVGTTQSLISKSKNGKLTMGSVGYTSAFSQDTHLLVGIERTEDESCSTMRILGNRNGPQGIEFDVRWDLDNGLVEEVGAPDDEGGMDYGGITS